ncbi:MAG: glycosyltransferase family 2 protein [Candidatus Peregrinibacteria bacterium]|nr:glycosyltransferase family 2 protein [Candidatus Peregrinibacteria bacterium]
MKLSVIIPTYNRADTLKTCLEKLVEQKGVDFEIIVVDDGSTDHTEKIMRDFREVKYVKQKNRHQGAARNNGANNAAGDILMFIGDDIFVEPGFLMRHMDIHSMHPGEDVAVLGYTTWDPSLNINRYMKFLEKSGWQFAYHLLKPGFVDHPQPYKFFYTSNISLKKSLFEKEKGFNESFKEYGWEDIELGYRCWKKHGLRLYYEPDARATHFHEIPESSLNKRMQTVGHTAVLFEKLEPAVSVVPKGLKRMMLTVVTHPISIALSRLLGINFYFKLKSWQEFLKGTKQKRS